MKQALIIFILILSTGLLMAEYLNVYTAQQNYEFDLADIISLYFSEDALQVETFEMIHTFMFDEILYLDFAMNTGSDQDEVPANINFLLKQNYPNPFNPDTNISFVLEESGKIEIDIFNSKGQKVRLLVDGRYSAGEHTVNWNGKSDQQKELPSGIYYYRMNSHTQFINKKMILLK